MADAPVDDAEMGADLRFAIRRVSGDGGRGDKFGRFESSVQRVVSEGPSRIVSAAPQGGGGVSVVLPGAYHSGLHHHQWAEGGIISEVDAKSVKVIWVVATGAPHHATGNRDLLSGITEHADVFVLGHGVDKATMQVLARGDVATEAVLLSDVWYVPGLMKNMVSAQQLDEQGYKVGFGGAQCRIKRCTDDKVVGKGHLVQGIGYVLDNLEVHAD